MQQHTPSFPQASYQQPFTNSTVIFSSVDAESSAEDPTSLSRACAVPELGQTDPAKDETRLSWIYETQGPIMQRLIMARRQVNPGVANFFAPMYCTCSLLSPLQTSA
uniref:Uncharacterized protein n=1 Tax=Sphaerodactylus townsendi TaxID=933632 RepID=A0ACB8G1N7_9SAUR